jgi:hypothetical protein
MFARPKGLKRMGCTCLWQPKHPENRRPGLAPRDFHAHPASAVRVIAQWAQRLRWVTCGGRAAFAAHAPARTMGFQCLRGTRVQTENPGIFLTLIRPSHPTHLPGGWPEGYALPVQGGPLLDELLSSFCPMQLIPRPGPADPAQLLPPGRPASPCAHTAIGLGCSPPPYPSIEAKPAPQPNLLAVGRGSPAFCLGE